MAHPITDGHAEVFPAKLGAVVQLTVMDGTEPVRLVIHDDQGDWLIGDGVNDPNLPGACKVICLNCVTAAHPTIAALAGMPRGQMAERASVDAPWQISHHSYDDD